MAYAVRGRALVAKAPVDGTSLILLIAIPVVLLAFKPWAPSILNTQNLLDILQQMSYLAIAAVGTTFVIIAARIDLSLGSIITVATTTTALLVTKHGLPVYIAVPLPIVIGAAVGVMNGLLTTKVRVNSIIATLGTMIVLAGGASLVVGGETIAGLPYGVIYLGTATFGSIPAAAFVLLAVWLCAEYTLRRTRLGRYAFHIGANERASTLNGIHVGRYVTAYYVIGGALAGLAGLILMGRLFSANVDIGSDMELRAIAVTVIGGTSLFGGRGSATGTVLAAALVTVINNGLTLTNADIYWEITVSGILIILAVAVDSLRRRGYDVILPVSTRVKKISQRTRPRWQSLPIADHVIWVVVGAAILAMSFLSPAFFTVNNLLSNVLRQSAVVGILALGMTFVVATRGLDLSIGSNVALSSSVMAILIRQDGASFWLAALAGLGIGCAIGATNGLLVAKFRIPPFVATLGMLSVARGLALVLAGSAPIDVLPADLLYLGRGVIWGVPVPVIILGCIWLICEYLMRSTRFGRYALAIGGNEEAARLSGVRVDAYKVSQYMFCGLLAAAGGIVLAGRLGAAQATTATGVELSAIAAVVVGGTSLLGGQARLAGSLGGAILVGVLTNGMQLRAIDSNWIDITVGIVMVFAVALDALRRSGSLRPPADLWRRRTAFRAAAGRAVPLSVAEEEVRSSD
jgi:ribose/xylose/arabinose/galactoside ABC-type transport system permease subunit